MARDWLRLVLAAAIASAVGAAPVAVSDASAQNIPSNPTKKKAANKKAGPEEGSEEAPPAKKRQDPAEAQKTIEAALKLIQGGKADAAVQSLTTTITAGNLPPGLLARALYYRGMGQRQQQKPAQAIADLTQALWIKGGLSETDRAEALKQRSGSYADAGIADQPLVVASAPPTAVTTGSNAPSSSSSSFWNPFSGMGNGFTLFNNGNQSARPAPETSAPPPATVASVPTAAAPKPSISSWSSTTEVRATPIATEPTPAPAATSPSPAASRPEGKFKVQLGLVRTDGEAQAIQARVRGDLATVFEAREAMVDETVVGNFGSMYRVRVGPYVSAGEGQAVCARLKGSGLDCLVTQ